MACFSKVFTTFNCSLPSSFHQKVTIQSTNQMIIIITKASNFYIIFNCCRHLHMAIAHGFLEVALALIRAVPHPKLLDIPNDDNQTPLHLAVETGQWKIARWLRVAGAKPCPRGPQGDSPLHIAARRNDPRSVKAIVEPFHEQERDQLGLSYQGNVHQSCDFDQWNFLGKSLVLCLLH